MCSISIFIALLGTRQQRREVLESIAAQMGFDPLIASNWYSQDLDVFRVLKVFFNFILLFFIVTYVHQGVPGVMIHHQQNIRQAVIDLFPDIGLDVTKFREREYFTTN